MKGSPIKKNIERVTAGLVIFRAAIVCIQLFFNLDYEKGISPTIVVLFLTLLFYVGTDFYYAKENTDRISRCKLSYFQPW